MARLDLADYARESARCPFHEDRRASFSVWHGQSGWRWKCHSGCGTGDEITFLEKFFHESRAEAIRRYCDYANGNQSPLPIRFPAVPATGQKKQASEIGTGRCEKLPFMPVEAIAKWNEGLDYLESHPSAVEELAQLRGWPAEWAQYLVECAIVSSPLYHGQRSLAFLVQAPEMTRGRLSLRDVGFHCRLAPRPSDKKPSWRFIPNAKEHRQSTPSLPFIMGGSVFCDARLIVITGGQWDALTFAFAAGWLGPKCHWPEGVFLLGLRGDSSSDTFLRAYEPFWPKAADCLVLPDNDASGTKWFEGAQSFAERLGSRCRKVVVVTCNPHKDFNDLYRESAISRESVASMLVEHGLNPSAQP